MIFRFISDFRVLNLVAFAQQVHKLKELEEVY